MQITVHLMFGVLHLFTSIQAGPYNACILRNGKDSKRTDGQKDLDSKNEANGKGEMDVDYSGETTSGLTMTT
ncbi:uncharacterized protein ANIA_11297 [Aspergillus nidulans FGSC A4]|uniref:Uncharacterized protein n=1 Tax=Emericella nidulans (strain FGSC A4 / ATCC 38163 / CBS 112.46 / NRRL 194 / M139) TaxID=227321 RepID=C8VSH0_EMENI|nr:hypothetical protein [Aspergillus nidulans FGSC A4]CBF87821.1 TPA: hypothetical protein ANIA_11297 [Aspergillus nidulans FGSC A4]